MRSRSIPLALVALAALLVAGTRLPLGAEDEGKDKDAIAGNAKALKARDNLENARTIAKKWKEDALLVSVKGISVKEDGTVDASNADDSAANWSYYFFSPGTKTEGQDDAAARFSITLVGGRVEKTPNDASFAEKVALPPDFIDSDKVWLAAKKANKDAKGTAMMDLSHHEETRDTPFQWVFTSESGFTGSFDAKSGNPVGKQQ